MFKVIKVDEENVYIASTEGGKTLKINKAKLDWEVKVYDYVEFYDAGNEIIVTKIPTEEALIILQKDQTQKQQTQSQIIVTNNPPMQSNKVNKITYVLLAWFLGGLGVHHFYANKPVSGILSLLFCWTLIPSLIATINFIIALCKPSDKDGNIEI
jgi:TM2 domain-containing membrane protein YozV